MTPQEYISSGILELYALGSASVAEQQEAEHMVATYPEVRKALEEIQYGLESYATLHAVTPDESLREKILGNIVLLGTADINNKTAKTLPETPKAKVIPLQPAAPSRWRNFAIAASVLFVLSLGYNIFQLLNADEMSTDNRHLAAQVTLLSDSAKQAATLRLQAMAQRDSLQHDLQFLRNPMTQSITLNSVLEGHPMKAMVHWDKRSMQVAIDPMTLPATNAGQKYVLWAIVDGKPVNEGDFSVSDSTGIMRMNTVPDAQAFAVTLENSGNVPAPEGPMYVMGKSSTVQP